MLSVLDLCGSWAFGFAEDGSGTGVHARHWPVPCVPFPGAFRLLCGFCFRSVSHPLRWCVACGYGGGLGDFDLSLPVTRVHGPADDDVRDLSLVVLLCAYP